MNKKYWAILAALLIIVTSFAACTKNYDEDRIITDRESNTHILATDENGQTMQDEDGNIMEIITDNKGKEVTDEDGKIVSLEKQNGEGNVFIPINFSRFFLSFRGLLNLHTNLRLLVLALW